MATVLIFGRPPPLKPYTHPVSATARALAAPAPRRRIEHHRRVHRTDRELKARRALRKVDAGAGRHRTNVQLGAAACHDLALPPPFRLEHTRTATPPGQAIVERVLTLHEPPDPPTIRTRPSHRTVPLRRCERHRRQRRQRARAAEQQRTGANVGECYPPVKRKTLPSQELNPSSGQRWMLRMRSPWARLPRVASPETTLP